MMDNETQPPEDRKPQWWDEFEELADQELEAGASCEQVHPIISRWFEQLLTAEPLASRPSIDQAAACLTTEILNSAPEEMIDQLLQIVDEDEVAQFIEQVLYIGRAFERALHNGELDDL